MFSQGQGRVLVALVLATILTGTTWSGGSDAVFTADATVVVIVVVAVVLGIGSAAGLLIGKEPMLKQ